MTALIKADTKDIPKIVEILAGSHSFAITGWALAIVFLLGGVASVVLLKNVDNREIHRLIEERNKLQSKLLGE